MKDKRINIEAKKPFLILENSLSGSELKNERIEPEKQGVAEGRNEETESRILGVLAGLEDKRTLEHRNKVLVKSIYAFYQGLSQYTV